MTQTSGVAVERLRLRPKPRKWVLVLHLVSSVGWIGVELVLLSLSITAAATDDPATAGASRMVAGMLGGTYYFPLSLLALLSGLWLSLGTRWGLLRHWWVATKLVLTLALFAGGNLAVIPAFTAVGAAAARGATDDGAMFVGAMTAGMTLLLVLTMLSVFKPGGRIRARERSTRTLTPAG